MHTGLFKRGSSFYLRLRVPCDLVSHYGKSEFKSSLKTKDLPEATRKLRAELARLEQEFAGIRNRMKHSFVMNELVVTRRITSLDDDTMDAIAATWLEQNLAADDYMRSLGEVGDMEEDIQQSLSILQPAYARGDITRVEPLARQFMGLLGIELSISDAEWRRLCLKLLEASLQSAQIRAKRLEGEVISTATVMAAAPERLSPPTAQGGQSLTQILENWKSVADRRPRTAGEMSSLVRRFEAYSKHKPVKALTRQDGIGWRDHMREHDKVAPGTVKKNLGMVTSLLNFAMDEGAIAANPFARIKIPQPKTAPVPRLPYSAGDIAQIFGSAIFVDRERPQGGGGEAAVWLPFIGAYTGARLEEIAQLRPEDLFQDKTYGWFFHILDLEEGQSVKTDSSRREVPVHPVLIKAGFIKYVAHIKKMRQAWLFPDLTPHVNGTHSGNWSKWWGRYARKKIGIKDKRKVFHSLRHSFKTACRAAHIPEEVHDALTGHSSASEGRSYGEQPLSVLRIAIDKISYSGVTPPSVLWPPKKALQTPPKTHPAKGGSV